jgi:hypothetical protein
MERICKYGKTPDVQKDCDRYEPKFKMKGKGKAKAECVDDWRCYFYRRMGGEHWCNGMYQNKDLK